MLCLSQVTGWGVLYYAFPVLAPSISASTGWSLSEVTAGFSLGQLVSAAVGVPLGRVLDRRGPRLVMTTGSVVAVAAVAGMTAARSPVVFLAAWALIGTGMAAVLYQPAFAAVTRWYGERRVRALTAVTLVGGLASTVFAPLTAGIAQHLDWRGAYLVLAGLFGLITIPAHALGLRLPWPPHEHDPRVDHAPDAVARSRPFAVLVVALGLGSFAVYAVVVALVPLLTERGLSTTTAAWALGLGGIGQVLGRLGYARFVAVTGVRARTAIVLLAASATTLLLGLVPGPALPLIAAAVLAGTARGVFTLVQATAVTDRWGAAHYGRLSGLLQAPMAVTAAVAPWVATALAGALGGYPPVFVVLAAAGVLAAGTSWWSVPRPAPKPGSA
ncbi:MFS transporter [Saccharothrix longispora]|uniref:MFS family permease n=1 Tax=Saccharothrix longispora TaxID=33920 RepID=A0ABU1PP46_9PSEU|nr:MFS transporter [Saccharothrix longispora]MDR6592395.1 MFS family permease [Saccharothrix longispora]